ncbi:hypothetical protein GCM10027047_20070 [Rhodococcus aerolatus]
MGVGARVGGWGRTAGSTAAERGLHYACDDVAPDLGQQLWRARTVRASPAAVWRWLPQLRVAPYSWDLVDNLGRRSPRTVDPDAPPLAVGQRALLVFAVASFAVDDHLTVLHRGAVSMAMTYRVLPHPRGSRLVVKVRCGYPGGPLGRALAALLPVGDAVMVDKQLRTLGGLAERDGAAPAA